MHRKMISSVGKSNTNLLCYFQRFAHHSLIAMDLNDSSLDTKRKPFILESLSENACAMHIIVVSAQGKEKNGVERTKTKWPPRNSSMVKETLNLASAITLLLIWAADSLNSVHFPKEWTFLSSVFLQLYVVHVGTHNCRFDFQAIWHQISNCKSLFWNRLLQPAARWSCNTEFLLGNSIL